jgi:hypothetical protein
VSLHNVPHTNDRYLVFSIQGEGNDCGFDVALDDASVLADMLEPLKLKTREIVCMPINNNSDVGKAGGSHWCVTRNINGK